jgi:hypothetical protein
MAEADLATDNGGHDMPFCKNCDLSWQIIGGLLFAQSTCCIKPLF